MADAFSLTEEQWRSVAPLLPKPRIRKDAVGTPWRDPRDVLDGILNCELIPLGQ